MKRIIVYLFVIFCLIADKTQADNHSLPSLLPGTYAIYWGCFDPPTLAHRDIITQTLLKQDVEAVIVVINNFNNQAYGADINNRLKMLEMLLQDHKDKIIYLIQDETHKADYKQIKSQINGKLIAIAGQDSFEKWTKHVSDFSDYDGIIVVPRFIPSSINSLPQLPENISVMNIQDTLYKCSSTQVRLSLLNDQQFSNFISSVTLDYINHEGLYRDSNFVRGLS